jgi:hypothetical protein
MTWTYQQSTGALTRNDGVVIGDGYSGNGKGLNEPDAESWHDIGPIPAGEWTIGTFFDDPGGKGPIVCHLTPLPATETFGRNGFMIHGDNAAMNCTASEGCIVLSRPLRQQIAASGDTELLVNP